MKKSVMVQVQGTIVDEWGEEDVIHLETPGMLYVRQGEYILLYKETELTGMEGTTTQVRIRGEEVVLNRMGTVDFRQRFMVGQTDSGTYLTPHGSFRMMVLPSLVDVDFSPLGGSVELEYELWVDEAKVSDNRLSIRVKGDD